MPSLLLISMNACHIFNIIFILLITIISSLIHICFLYLKMSLLLYKISRMCRPFNFTQRSISGSIHFTHIMNIHQQFRIASTHYFRQCFFWFFQSYILTLRNHRMTADICWSFDHPIACFLFFKTALLQIHPGFHHNSALHPIDLFAQ